MLIKRIQSFFNPEQFQGWNKKKKYFEGWYYKIVNNSETKAFAFIPGIAIDDDGKKHAFIQVLDGKNRTSDYFRFEGSEFKPKSGILDFSIGNNKFTEYDVDLKLPEIEGQIKFAGNVPWPKPFYAPGIMGPYAFVPFMECYHGIISMDHEISGSMKIAGETIDFTGGRGYIEKDWGQSFPSAYAWMQTNHFSKPGISLKASVANIPWIKNDFVGFIAGLWFDNRLYRFTTYNQTKLRKCSISKNKVHIILENKKHLLELIAHRDHATVLASPILGLMDGRIEESMTSNIHVELTDKISEVVVFSDEGRNAGLEVAGNIQEIIT